MPLSREFTEMKESFLSIMKMVLGKLWRTKARGAYNVDGVLRVMVRGLQRELDERMVEATEAFR